MTTIKGVWIPAAEYADIELVEIERGDYKEFQKYVGGLFDAVNLFNPDCSVFVNDEGLIIGLELNRRATLLAWVHNVLYREAQNPLVGDVLLLGRPDDEGDTQGVPQELIDLFFNTTEYKYEIQPHGDTSWSGNQMRYDNWVDAYNGVLSLASRWTLVNLVRVVAA